MAKMGKGNGGISGKKGANNSRGYPPKGAKSTDFSGPGTGKGMSGPGTGSGMGGKKC